MVNTYNVPRDSFLLSTWKTFSVSLILRESKDKYLRYLNWSFVDAKKTFQS